MNYNKVIELVKKDFREFQKKYGESAEASDYAIEIIKIDGKDIQIQIRLQSDKDDWLDEWKKLKDLNREQYAPTKIGVEEDTPSDEEQIKKEINKDYDTKK